MARLSKLASSSDTGTVTSSRIANVKLSFAKELEDATSPLFKVMVCGTSA